ncbi:hypothetical protein WR25_07806 isoform B [Diploscapter pachys]|uniref:Nudix hydrolase domain-containing protein n=1 Tax=Diploscapter pachys TaxID=2018661 RepID=A0A2A2JPQ3_9BILA|nr:hypothetical protein WR25_07806 isoform B [Diploscapter pachys]
MIFNQRFYRYWTHERMGRRFKNRHSLICIQYGFLSVQTADPCGVACGSTVQNCKSILGHVERKETAKDTILREISEETGYKNCNLTFVGPSNGRLTASPEKANDMQKVGVVDCWADNFKGDEADDEELVKRLLIKDTELWNTFQELGEDYAIVGGLYSFALGYALRNGQTWELLSNKADNPDKVVSAFALVRVHNASGTYFLFNRQFRIPTRSWTIEFPGGHVERGETARDAILRELREETGYYNCNISFVSIGRLSASPAKSNDMQKMGIVDCSANDLAETKQDDEEVLLAISNRAVRK